MYTAPALKLQESTDFNPKNTNYKVLIASTEISRVCKRPIRSTQTSCR